MTQNVDDLFKGMKTAKMFGRGNYMGEGDYVVEVTKCFTKKSFKGPVLFICEFTIVTSDNEKHKPGSTGTWAPKIDLQNTFGDIKSLMFSACGTDPKDVKDEDEEAHASATLLARAACGSETAIAELKAQGFDSVPILGSRVKLECRQIKTRANTDFTRYSWSPAPAEAA